MKTVQLKYLSYHPNIWGRMIGDVSTDCKAGDLVKVLGKKSEPFGIGFWNPRAKIPLRIAAHGDLDPDEEFFLDAIRRAGSLRREILRLDDSTEAYRAIHGDADQLPGLVVDKFADVLSIEVSSLAVWQRLESWVPVLHETFATQRVRIQVDPEIARVESLPIGAHPLHQNIRPLKIREFGIPFEINFAESHKTGFFCDQRDNRHRFSTMCQGRDVLDLCCYTGGFSVNAALAGAKEVTAVDLDERAVEMAKRNANINQARVKFTHADAFTWVRTMIENGRQWDVVLADPPKFIHGKDEDRLGYNKYCDLNALVLKLVKPGGIFVTCSCSGMLTPDDFERIIISAAHRQNLRLQIIARTGAGGDHPTLSNYPESQYLKVIWARVLA
ncbi:MAG: class I SAM-dependent rRNA methyltransferase [Akkermansiaceae bacterium]